MWKGSNLLIQTIEKKLETQDEPSHPHLYFTSADIPSLKTKITSGIAKQIWDDVSYDICERYLDPSSYAYINLTDSIWTSPSTSGCDSNGVKIQEMALCYILTDNTSYSSKTIDYL